VTGACNRHIRRRYMSAQPISNIVTVRCSSAEGTRILQDNSMDTCPSPEITALPLRKSPEVIHHPPPADFSNIHKATVDTASRWSDVGQYAETSVPCRPTVTPRMRIEYSERDCGLTAQQSMYGGEASAICRNISLLPATGSCQCPADSLSRCPVLNWT